MKLPTSKKTGNKYGKKPHIKKGYYPAKLISIEERKNNDGSLYEGKYGHQLIFMLQVHNTNDKGAPTTPITYKDDNVEREVTLPKFSYHTYKDQKTGEFRTAITPNSAVTKILHSLDPTWQLGEEEVDTERFLNKWVEVNIDDYEATDLDGKNYKASTVKDINKWEGATPSFKDAEAHTELKNKLDDMKKMHEEGMLSDDGLRMATESIEEQMRKVE